MDSKTSNLHVVMFPFFAFGHISPFAQLSNKLSSHGVHITFLSASANLSRTKSMLNPSQNSQVVPLTLPAVDGLPPGIESTFNITPSHSELLKVALELMQPQIKSLLSKIKPHFVIFDFAMDWLPKMASELGIKTCFYSTFIALSTAFLTVPARLPDPATCPSPEQLKLPPPGFPKTSVTSVKDFEARDFTYIFKRFHNGTCVYDRVISNLTNCSVVIARTCHEMEAPYIEYVKSQLNKPILSAGPVVPSGRPEVPLDEKWEKWLSQFEAKSVIFCAFGSESFLKDDEIRELALGLEMTGLPFVVILNFPDSADPAAELKRVLPEGFAEGVKGKGVISTGWVQQQLILAHPSVGCFLTHAGLSSLIEGIVNECQLVMLPLKGDQFLNSKLVGGDWGAGMEVNRREEDGYFGKEDIKRAVECVMVRVSEEPGKSIRENHKKWVDFFLDKGFEERLFRDLVKELEGIAGI